MAKKRGHGWTESRASRSKQKAAKAQKALNRKRDKALQTLYTEHLAQVGCFAAGRKCEGELQGAHRKGREVPRKKRVFAQIVYRVPSSVKQKIRDLRPQLTRTGVLCKSCHKLYDSDHPPTWASSFTQRGAVEAKWGEFLKGYATLSRTLSDSTP